VSVDVMLFGLRLASVVFLLGMLAALFIVLWRDYRTAAVQAADSRRTYGQLVALLQIDDIYAPTGEAYPLRPLTSLGRSPTNSIVIDDNFASGEHATISLKEAHWWLEDRNSRNGTLLNGELIASAIIVTDGDIVSIGNTHLKLTFD
jgi:FHA domain